MVVVADRPLTQRQLEALGAAYWLHRQGRGWLTGRMLADALDTSPQGAHRTVAALVRHGYMRKTVTRTAGGSTLVLFRLTEAGTKVAR